MMAKGCFFLTATVGVGLLLSGCSSGTASSVTAPASSVPPSASSGPPTSTPSAVETSTPPVKSDPVDAAFKTKVDALCLSWLADNNKHPAPFYMGNPVAVTASQLPQAGVWLDSLAVNHELVESMKKLGAPAKGAEAWSTLSSRFAAFQADQTAAITAAKASDLNGWTTQAVAADKDRDAILSGLITSGLPFSDPCQIVFARGGYHGE
jgi:hypothetical protein